MFKKISISILTTAFLFLFILPVFGVTERTIERGITGVENDIEELIEDIIDIVSERIKEITSAENPALEFKEKGILTEKKKEEIEKKMIAIKEEIADLREKVDELDEELNTDVPINIDGEVTANGEVELTWKGNADTEYYVGYKATKSGGPYTEVGITEKLTGKVTGLEGGKTYYFVVTQVVDEKESEYSEEIKIKMPTFTTPYNIKGEVVNVGQLELTWSSKEDVTKYRIYRSTKSGGSYTLIGESTTKKFTDTSLSLYTTYYYVITQIVDGEESEYSAEHMDNWYYNWKGEISSL